MDAVWKAFGLVLDPYVLVVMLAASIFGIVVGAIPGLTATMAVALMLPITFFMDPIPALAAILSCVGMAIFAGDIPSTLLRIPGTPASAAYTDDAYGMTLKGQAELALGVNLVYSALGGIIGSVALAVGAPLLAEVALSFSTFEYFWLACLGLTCGAVLSTDSPLKGAASLLLGLWLATIGVDPTAGQPRFTFGVTELLAGIGIIPALIGMFAIPELLRNVAEPGGGLVVTQQRIGNIFAGLWRTTFRYWKQIARGNIVGIVIGALPGAGADIAAWVSYAISKHFSKEPEKFGTGHVEGIVESTSSNNSAIAAGWIPALVFGIPGSSVAAMVIGILYVKDLNPGPTVFIEKPHIIYAVFIAFFLSNVLMVPIGLVSIRMFRHILSIPKTVLNPLILVFCIVGAFAMNNTVFGVVIMLALGMLAYLMEENGFPTAPLVLSLVLGEILEHSFMTSMIKAGGDLRVFFERPIAGTLGVITIFLWTLPLWRRLWQRMRTPPMPRAST